MNTIAIVSFMLEWWQNIPETINPIAFGFGLFSVYWYAVYFLVGFFAVFLFAIWLARKRRAPCSEECVFDLFLFIFFGALIGGRIGYVLFYNFDIFLEAPSKIFLPYDFSSGIWVGISGMSYYGGLIGVGLALYWFARVKNVNFWDTADFVAFLAPIAIFFGRLGNFFNLELYGRITNRPWGMLFPSVEPIGVLRHPSSLYEAFLEGLILFILLLFLRKKLLSLRKYAGLLTCIYLAFYAILRFFAEFFREPDSQLELFFNVLTLGQIFSFLVFFPAGIIFIWLKYQNRAKMAQDV